MKRPPNRVFKGDSGRIVMRPYIAARNPCKNMGIMVLPYWDRE